MRNRCCWSLLPVGGVRSARARGSGLAGIAACSRAASGCTRTTAGTTRTAGTTCTSLSQQR